MDTLVLILDTIIVQYMQDVVCKETQFFFVLKSLLLLDTLCSRNSLEAIVLAYKPYGK